MNSSSKNFTEVKSQYYISQDTWTFYNHNAIVVVDIDGFTIYLACLVA